MGPNTQWSNWRKWTEKVQNSRILTHFLTVINFNLWFWDLNFGNEVSLSYKQLVQNVHVHIIYKVAKEYLFNNSIANSSLISCLHILDWKQRFLLKFKCHFMNWDQCFDKYLSVSTWVGWLFSKKCLAIALWITKTDMKKVESFCKQDYFEFWCQDLIGAFLMSVLRIVNCES